MRSNIAAHASATEKIKSLLTNVRDVREQRLIRSTDLPVHCWSSSAQVLLLMLMVTMCTFITQVADELGQTLRTDEIVEWALEVDETGEA